MNDPQDNQDKPAVQHETDHENETNETQPFDPNDYPIRINDPDIERVVGMSYD